MSTLHVLIIGAGIAGPVLAAFLAKIGVHAVICEGREVPTGQEGGFLAIAPNGMHILAELGLAAQVQASGTVCEGFRFQNAKERYLGHIDRRDDARRFGQQMVMIKRGVLNDILLAQAVKQNVEVRYNQRLIAVSHQPLGKVEARFADGRVQTCDMLVGCDGLRSAVRNLIAPTPIAPTYCGLLDFCGYATFGHPPLPVGHSVMVFGKRAFFGGFCRPADTKGESEVWWFHNGVEERPLRSLDDAEKRQRLLEVHAEDPPWITACVQVSPEILGPWPMHEIPTLPAWHVGPVGVIGDAAHAMSPSAGQGASLAMEDAMVLAQCLRRTKAPAHAFAELYQLRHRRVQAIAEQARRQSKRKAMPGPVAAWFRDRLMPLFVGMGARQQERVYADRLNWEALQPLGARQ